MSRINPPRDAYLLALASNLSREVRRLSYEMALQSEGSLDAVLRDLESTTLLPPVGVSALRRMIEVGRRLVEADAVEIAEIAFAREQGPALLIVMRSMRPQVCVHG